MRTDILEVSYDVECPIEDAGRGGCWGVDRDHVADRRRRSSAGQRDGAVAVDGDAADRCVVAANVDNEVGGRIAARSQLLDLSASERAGDREDVGARIDRENFIRDRCGREEGWNQPLRRRYWQGEGNPHRAGG